MRPLPDDLVARLDRDGRELAILVVRMGAFGDVLRTLPPVRLLRARLPASRIAWVVDDRWAPILDGHPDVSHVVRLPRAAWKEMKSSPGQWLRLGSVVGAWATGLRSLRVDLVLDFHGNLRSGLVGALSRAPVRLGYSGHWQKEGNRLFTTHHVPSGERRASRMERNLRLVRALGIPDHPLPDGGIPIPTASVEVAKRIVDSRPYAVLSPGASRKQIYKKPPPALLIAAAQQLAAHGMSVLVVYGPGETADAEEIVRAASPNASLAPPTDLHVLAALLRGARVFVGGDSGPLHLACAMRCAVLGLYGPTDPAVNAPWGVPNVALAPAGRIYTGIKRLDRSAGGFQGLGQDAVRAAVDEILALVGQAR